MLEVKKFKDVPWKDMSYDCEWYSVFEVDDQEIFVPKNDNMADYREALTAAYRYTRTMHETKKHLGYKIVVEFGEIAGQEISWPYVKVIHFDETKKKNKGK